MKCRALLWKEQWKFPQSCFSSDPFTDLSRSHEGWINTLGKTVLAVQKCQMSMPMQQFKKTYQLLWNKGIQSNMRLKNAVRKKKVHKLTSNRGLSSGTIPHTKNVTNNTIQTRSDLLCHHLSSTKFKIFKEGM